MLERSSRWIPTLQEITYGAMPSVGEKALIGCATPKLLLKGTGAGTGRMLLSEEPKRSEEHTSELQSLRHLVCRLLLEKKKNIPVPIPLSPRARTHDGSRERTRTQ